MYRNQACTRTLKWGQNERNVTGSSIAINFHSRWGKKNLSKSTKNVRNFTDVICFMNAYGSRMFELFIHTKAKAWVLPTSFAVIFYRLWLCLSCQKAEFNFELICTLPFLFSELQAAALNPLSVFKTLLKENRSPCFRRGWRKVWRLRSPWSSILRPPKHRLMFFLSIFSAKEEICLL